jgi:uncharacterized membrane-anchored protein YhcB (DUF1043 family)
MGVENIENSDQGDFNMVGEITLWIWGLVVFTVGGGTGYFLARQIKSQRTRGLEQELDTTRSDLSEYRGEVDRHFLKTSLLLSKLTDNYREVYEHLATGAQKLCNDPSRTPALDLPETRILPPADDTSPHASKASAPLAVAPEAAGEISETATDTSVTTTAATENAAFATAEPPPPVEEATDDDGMPLGAESTPAVDTELRRHEPPPSIH